MKPKTSPIWNYFIDISAIAARCKICEKEYSRKGRTTTALKSHLKAVHLDKFKEFEKLDEDNKQALIANEKHGLSLIEQAKKQLSFQELLVHMDKFDEYENSLEDNKASIANEIQAFSSTLQAQQSTSFQENSRINDFESIQQLDRLISEMIILQDLPFSFVEGVGFRRLMFATIPQYKLKGRQFFTSFICNDLYNRMEDKIKHLLADFEKLTLTVDIWPELTPGVSLLNLAVHGINHNLERVKIILKSDVLKGDHSEEAISLKIQSVFQDFGIKQQSLHCMISNRDSNSMKIKPLSGIDNLDCIIDQIQGCIKNVVQSEEWLVQLVAKLEQIRADFKNSPSAQDELKDIQVKKLGESPLSPIQDYPNRWNGLFYMMERFLKIKESLDWYQSTNLMTKISFEDWLNIEKFVKILKPFEEITRELSNSQNGISSVIPLTQTVLTVLQNEAQKNDEQYKRLIKKLFVELDLQFSNLTKNRFYTISTYLDPRYKTRFFNEIVIDEVETAILKLSANEYCNGENDGSPPSSKKRRINESNSRQNEPSTSQTNSQLELLLESILNADESELEDDTNGGIMVLKTMLDDYKIEKRLPLKEDPLKWWRINAPQYSALFPIVRRFLSAPPSSTISEQLFNETVRRYNEKGNKVCDDEAAKLLFLKHNLPALNFNY